jgi:hypothetical protein
MPKMENRTFPALAGAGAHGIYPALDATLWFTAQYAGKLAGYRYFVGSTLIVRHSPF